MVRVYVPKARNTGELVKFGTFQSLRYSDMEYVGIPEFFFRAILYAKVILELFTFSSFTEPFLLHLRYSLFFSHFVSQLCRYLLENPLLD